MNRVIHACRLCHDTGWVSVIDRKAQMSFAFRCGNCGAADRFNLSHKIPTWSTPLKSQYRIWGEE